MSLVQKGWMVMKCKTTKAKKKGKKTREESIKEGNRFYCANCKVTYKEVPTEVYEDGHGGRLLTMCRCGCDIICSLSDDSLVNENGETS